MTELSRASTRSPHSSPAVDDYRLFVAGDRDGYFGGHGRRGFRPSCCSRIPRSSSSIETCSFETFDVIESIKTACCSCYGSYAAILKNSKQLPFAPGRPTGCHAVAASAAGVAWQHYPIVGPHDAKLSSMITCGPTEPRWERRLVALVFRLSSRNAWSGQVPAIVSALPASPSARSRRTSFRRGRRVLTRAYTVASTGLSRFAQKFPRLRGSGQLLVYIADQYQRYFVDLSGEYEIYLAKFSAKSRSTLRRKLRKV